MRKKAVGVPTAPITSPAAAGPAIRARLKIALLRAMALGMSPVPTISVTNACRVGLSTSVARPSPKASAYTCQMRTDPVTASTPRVSASSPIAVWVSIRMRRLG